MAKIEITAVLGDGTVEQYHVDAKRLVFEPTSEALAARETANAARQAFIADMRGLMERHGVRLCGSGWEYQGSNLMLVALDWEMSVEEACDE